MRRDIRTDTHTNRKKKNVRVLDIDKLLVVSPPGGGETPQSGSVHVWSWVGRDGGEQGEILLMESTISPSYCIVCTVSYYDNEQRDRPNHRYEWPVIGNLTETQFA